MGVVLDVQLVQVRFNLQFITTILMFFRVMSKGKLQHGNGRLDKGS